MRVEQVFITPLEDNEVYGAEQDVSEYVKIDGLSKIKQSIDSTDYSIGVYRFSDVKLKCVNSRGTFNENDSRSIFPFVRDKAKVRIQALKINPDDFSIQTVIQFEGLINDEMTRQNLLDDTISITVYSKDSILRTTQVQAGIIAPGSTAKNALLAILSQPDITKVLTIDSANINPFYDFIIDTPSALDNLKVEEALRLILQASGSALLLVNDEIIVQERENTESSPPILELKGRGEITGNSNIISISEYNNGKQRQFNSVRLNDGAITVRDADSIAEYGLRQIEFDFPMVNETSTLTEIGENTAEEFRYPKIELKVNIAAETAEGRGLLDLVEIDAPWLKKPSGDFMPVCGTAVCGDSATPLPDIFGSLQIQPNIRFKIIAIENNSKNFTAMFKLRQIGRAINGGVV